METSRNKYKENIWKAKLRESQKEKKKNAKEIHRYKSQIRRYRGAIKMLKAEILKQKKGRISPEPPIVNESRPHRHKFQTWLILIAIQFQVRDNLSFRQVREILNVLLKSKGLAIKPPSASTIRNWVRKLGFYRLWLQEGLTTGNKVLIMDLSAGIGREKVLVILAVPIREWEENPESLCFTNVQVLIVKTANTWNAEGIRMEIKNLEQKINGEIEYIITDRDTTMRCACRLSGYKNVSDSTHWMSSCLEKYFKEGEEFNALFSKVGKMRQKWVNSKNSPLMAPNMRTKSRFLNLYGIIDWLSTFLINWEQISPEIQQEVSFIQQHKALIEELAAMLNLIKEISKVLKNKGIGKNTIADVEALFDGVVLEMINVACFKNDMVKYINDIQMLLPGEKPIICCSDVIESMFGKFKYRGNKSASQGITDDVMTLSLFGGNLTHTEVEEAMEMVTLGNIEQWSDENTVPSFLKSRKEFFRKLGAKRA